MTRYLTTEDVVRQVARLGHAIRDLGLLASAVDRPRQSAFGEDAYKTIWLKAAALCQSLDHNRALVDGNKRIAWIFTKTFLRINGHVLGATDHEAETFMLHMVAAGGSLEDIGEWLEVHTSEAELPGGDADFAH